MHNRKFEAAIFFLFGSRVDAPAIGKSVHTWKMGEGLPRALTQALDVWLVRHKVFKAMNLASFAQQNLAGRPDGSGRERGNRDRSTNT